MREEQELRHERYEENAALMSAPAFKQRQQLGSFLVAAGAAGPSPPPIDSEEEQIPEKLQIFQGGTKYHRWGEKVISTPGINLRNKLDQMINEGSLKLR